MASRLLLLAAARRGQATSWGARATTFGAWTTATAAATIELFAPATTTTPTAARRAFAAADANAKGALPDRGPARQKLRAVPFEATRDEADAAFARYHSRHWLQARQLPALRRGAKETFLPFWVVPPGGALARTRLSRASLGVDRLVSRYDARTGKREPRWETEWTDVALNYDSVAAVLAIDPFLGGGRAGGGGAGGPSPAEQERACAQAAAAAGVDYCYSPGDVRLQLYAGSPKYGRGDARKVGPAWAVGRARPITPDMLSPSPLSSSSSSSSSAAGGAAARQRQEQQQQGEEDECRRVGPFVMPPDVARRLAARQLEALEGQRCEDAVRALTPRALRQGGGGMAMHVRLLDLRVEFLGTGDGGGGGGVAVAPVYAPVFVFSWRHAGVKVRTMVSGVRPQQPSPFRGGDAADPSGAAVLLRVAGPILPDETKVAVLTTAAVLLGLQVTGAAALMSSASLFYGGFVLPFIGAGLAARVWPAARTLADRGGERAADAAAGIAGAGAVAAKGLYARLSSTVQQLFGVRLPGSSGGASGQQASSSSSSADDSTTTSFDADYVRAYEQAESARSRRAAEEEARRARAGQDYGGVGGGGPGGGGGGGGPEGDDDPFSFTAEDLAEAVRNPFAWAERKAAEMARRHARRRASQQARRDQYERRYGGGASYGGQGQQQQQQQWQRQQQRQRQQQQQQRPGPRPPGASARDPQGFYHALGVSPEATTAEIQAAFRGRAMRDHPDRAGPGASEAERAVATSRFQRLSAAYHCLRDPRRRRDYDAGLGGQGGA